MIMLRSPATEVASSPAPSAAIQPWISDFDNGRDKNNKVADHRSFKPPKHDLGRVQSIQKNGVGAQYVQKSARGSMRM